MSTATMPAVDRVEASRMAVCMRRERAALKEALRTGEREHRDVLLKAKNTTGTPEATLRVTEFLLTLRFVGATKAQRILDELGISPCKRLGGLGRQQAADLWEFLGRWLREHPMTIARG